MTHFKNLKFRVINPLQNNIPVCEIKPQPPTVGGVDLSSLSNYKRKDSKPLSEGRINL
jgi:hypothetical protein